MTHATDNATEDRRALEKASTRTPAMPRGPVDSPSGHCHPMRSVQAVVPSLHLSSERGGPVSPPLHPPVEKARCGLARCATGILSSTIASRGQSQQRRSDFDLGSLGILGISKFHPTCLLASLCVQPNPRLDTVLGAPFEKSPFHRQSSIGNPPTPTFRRPSCITILSTAHCGLFSASFV